MSIVNCLNYIMLFLSGEKPFVCPVCGMRFTRNFNMKEHLTKHGSSKPYQCRFCEENFQTRHIRRRHEQDVHRKFLSFEMAYKDVHLTHFTNTFIIRKKIDKSIDFLRGGEKKIVSIFRLGRCEQVRLSGGLNEAGPEIYP